MELAIHDIQAGWPFVIAIGVLVGLAQSLFGLGGGVVVVPLLPLVFLMEPRQAVASSLVALAPVALINSIRVIFRGEMDWRRVLRIGPAAMIGSSVAATYSSYVEGRALIAGFGLATGWMAYHVFFKTVGNRRSFAKPWDFLAGLVAGVASGFTGVSTGVVLLPYLNRIQELALARVVPTSIGVIALSALASAFTFAVENSAASTGTTLFSYEVVGLLAIAAILTSQVGLQFQSRVPQRIKLAVVGTLLIGLTVRSLLHVIGIASF